MTYIKKAICGGILASILLLGGCSQKEAESPFQPFLQGDFSMLCQSEAYDAEDLEQISHDLSTGNFTFEEMDVSGDGEKELLVKSPNDPTVVRGVFYQSGEGIQCWLWDEYGGYVWTVEEDGILRRHYSGDSEGVLDKRISFDADGRQGVVADVGGDVPRLVVFGSYTPLEEEDPRWEFGSGLCTLTIYRMDDRSLFQTLVTTVSWHELVKADETISIEDWNFDGYLDISYLNWLGAYSAGDRVLLWDAQQGVFCDNEELAQLQLPSIDAENKVIREWIHSRAGAYGVDNYYRYIDGKLTCVRSVEHDEGDLETVYSVKDYQDGELKMVFYETIDKGEPWIGNKKVEEWSKWKDINYHGE